MHQRRWQLGWLIAGGMLVAWGLYCYVGSRETAELRTADVSELERGEPLPGRWLRLKGRLRPDDRLIFDGAEFKETYVPLVSPSWQPGQPIAVLVRTTDEEWGKPAALLHHDGEVVEGIVDSRGLDDAVRRLFDLDDRKAAPNVRVLDFQRKPDDRLAYAYVCLPLGLVIVLVAGSLWFFAKQEPTS